jgi:hypothetical protein
MTAIDFQDRPGHPGRVSTYQFAHWYLLAAFAVVIAGFWPTFFRPLGAATPLANIHGVTSSLWYVGLILQAWLITNGQRAWHRRVARGILLLLPVMCISGLANTRHMLAASLTIPLPVRPFIAFLDVQLTLQLLVLVALGIWAGTGTIAPESWYSCLRTDPRSVSHRGPDPANSHHGRPSTR